MPIIPSGFGSATVTCATVGSTHNSQFTFGFQDDVAQTMAAKAGVIWNALTQISRPFAQSNMDLSWSLEGVKIQVTPPTLGPVVFDFVNHWQGTGSQSAVPMNSAFIINKFTGFAGRHFAGRMFSPPIAVTESAITSAGIIAPADVTAQSAKWDGMRAFLATANLPMYLLHSDATPPTLISQLFLSPKVGTLKRRLRA